VIGNGGRVVGQRASNTRGCAYPAAEPENFCLAHFWGAQRRRGGVEVRSRSPRSFGLYWRFSSGGSTWFKLKRKTGKYRGKDRASSMQIRALEVRVKYEQGAFNDYITQYRAAFVVL